MTDTLSPPDLRLVAHRASAAELQVVNTTELSDQALVMVGTGASAALYRLNKLASPTPGPGVIVPGAGPGQWELLVAPGTSTGATALMFADAAPYMVFPNTTPGTWELPSSPLLTLEGPALPNWATSGAGALVYTAGPGAPPYYAEMTFTVGLTAGGGPTDIDVAVDFNNELAGTTTNVLRQNRLTLTGATAMGVVRGRFTPAPGCQLRPVVKGAVAVRFSFFQVTLQQLTA